MRQTTEHEVERIMRQHAEDIAFLVPRASRAGWIEFGAKRDYGMSSNSIVAIAYGVRPLDKQVMPSDLDDMRACRNMWAKLPEHRKTPDAVLAMQRAEECEYYGKEHQ